MEKETRFAFFKGFQWLNQLLPKNPTMLTTNGETFNIPHNFIIKYILGGLKDFHLILYVSVYEVFLYFFFKMEIDGYL